MERTKSANRVRILLIEDDEDDYILVRQILSEARASGRRFDLVWAPTFQEGLRQFDGSTFAAILVDYSLGEHSGLEVVQEVVRRGSLVPVILLTGQGNYDVDLMAMNAGAVDYLTKDEISAPLLERSIRYAIERKQTEFKLRQDAARFELLSNLSKDFVGAGLDYLSMVNKITRRISEALGDAIIVRILEEEGKTLEPAAMYHPDPQTRDLLAELLAKTSLHVGDGLEGEVARTEEPKYVCDMPLDELVRHTKDEFDPWLQRYPVASVFGAPLCSHSRLLGTLVVVRLQPAGAISPEDQSFYIDLAYRAAMAIDNAILLSEVQRLALTDPLTGLFNRRGFTQHGQREVDRHQRYGNSLSVILVDIDHFKAVNDTYGHVFGDEVLKALAESCTANIRKTDIAGRYGGDEFIILLPETDLTTASEVANRINTCFSRTAFIQRDKEIQLTASMGVTAAVIETKGLDELIGQADTALYKSKEKGGGRAETF